MDPLKRWTEEEPQPIKVVWKLQDKNHWLSVFLWYCETLYNKNFASRQDKKFSLFECKFN